MTRHLQHEVLNLKKRIIELGILVQQRVEKATAAIIVLNDKLAGEVIEGDREIDTYEVDLEEECLKLLALHQPVAIDLRFIVAVLKMNSDLERIGDLAVNIAQRAKNLTFLGTPLNIPLINEMVEKTKRTLENSLQCLVEMDSTQATAVLASDTEIDEINRKVYTLVKEEMKRDTSKIDQMLLVLAISKNLERIADHASNIAEDVIYMNEGEIVRHGKGRY